MSNYHAVPTSVLIPRLKKFLSEYETHGTTNIQAGQPGFFSKLSPTQIVADRAEVDPTLIAKIIKGEIGKTSFWVADRILTAMDQQLDWHADPELAEHYWPKGERPPDESRTQRCLNPECPNGGWFPVPVDPRQRHCDRVCEQRHGRIRTRPSNKVVGKRLTCAAKGCNVKFRLTPPEGEMKTGAWTGQKYCSDLCARRQAMREYRKRQKEALNETRRKSL